jgi:hypothetical protein
MSLRPDGPQWTTESVEKVVRDFLNEIHHQYLLEDSDATTCNPPWWQVPPLVLTRALRCAKRDAWFEEEAIEMIASFINEDERRRALFFAKLPPRRPGRPTKLRDMDYATLLNRFELLRDGGMSSEEAYSVIAERLAPSMGLSPDIDSIKKVLTKARKRFGRK